MEPNHTRHSPFGRKPGLRWLAALALLLALGTGALIAEGEGGSTSFGGAGTGGDTVGSLPLMAAPPGSETGEPLQPIFTLIGRDQDVLDLIIDAYPTAADAAYRRVGLEEPGLSRYEFYGRLVLVLDRAALQQLDVSGEILVGSSFSGGMAQLRVNNQLRATQVLYPGSFDMRLRLLDATGVLGQGLSWHALSLSGVHRVIAAKSFEDRIKLEQRE